MEILLVQVLDSKGDDKYEVLWFMRRNDTRDDMESAFKGGEVSVETITFSNLVHVCDSLTAKGTIRVTDRNAIRRQVQRSANERANGETVCFLCGEDRDEDVDVECDTTLCPRRFHKSCVALRKPPDHGVAAPPPRCRADCCADTPCPVPDPEAFDDPDF